MHFSTDPFTLDKEQFAQLYSEALWIEHFRNEQRVATDENLLMSLATLMNKQQ